MKGFEEQEWTLTERTSTPMTGCLKQQKTRRLSLGSCVTSREEKGLGLDSFLPISETQDVGVRATPTASRVEGALWSGHLVGSALLPSRRWNPLIQRLCLCVLGCKSSAPPFHL